MSEQPSHHYSSDCIPLSHPPRLLLVSETDLDATGQVLSVPGGWCQGELCSENHRVVSRNLEPQVRSRMVKYNCTVLNLQSCCLPGPSQAKQKGNRDNNYNSVHFQCFSCIYYKRKLPVQIKKAIYPCIFSTNMDNEGKVSWFSASPSPWHLWSLKIEILVMVAIAEVLSSLRFYFMFISS